MKRTAILLIGDNETTDAVFYTKLRSQPGWEVVITAPGEPAIEKFHRQHFDVVFFSNDIPDADEKKLRRIITVQHPDMVIYKTNQGDNTQLIAAVKEDLKKIRDSYKPAVSFTDDALRYARLNIRMQ